MGKWKFEVSLNIKSFSIYIWLVGCATGNFFQRGDYVLSLFQDDQDEVNQNYLADEEEEAEEEARVMVVPNLEEEEEEEEVKEEEEKDEEEGQGQPTGNTWWRKLQIMNEYLWDPEKRMSLARTGQSWSKSQLSQCPTKVSFPFGLVYRTHLPYVGWACLQTCLRYHVKGSMLREMSGLWADAIRTNSKWVNNIDCMAEIFWVQKHLQCRERVRMNWKAQTFLKVSALSLSICVTLGLYLPSLNLSFLTHQMKEQSLSCLSHRISMRLQQDVIIVKLKVL